MTDHDALLAAILAHLDEDTPRLAYADWLDENAGSVECPTCGGDGGVVVRQHETRPPVRLPGGRCATCGGTGSVPDGRAARAEFIRVQVELATCGPCPATIYHLSELGPHEHPWKQGSPPIIEPKEPCGWCPVCVLRRRERELLDAHALDWSGPAAKAMGLPAVTVFTPGLEYGYGDTSWRFTRGFVSHVTLPLAAFLGGPCRRCEGTGRQRYESNPRRMECLACAGSGTLPGIAAAVFGAQPVEGVTLSDREPDQIGDEWCWIRHRYGIDDPGAVLPEELFGKLGGGRKETDGADWLDTSGVGDEWVVYPAPDLALTALSDACVLFGRKRWQTDTVSVGEVGP